ncbi:MAG: hypothetical protein ACTSR0_00470 [Candidatus Asgardarchaeia archaeon]
MSYVWKLPPRVKVMEALGAIADGRIEFPSENEAKVRSSDLNKTYTVKFDLEKMEIISNDNGSFYRGYLGYPSIAVLMIKGILPFSKEIAEGLKGIKWKELNEKYKMYYKTEFVAKKIAERRGVSSEEVDSFIKKVIEKIKELKIKKLKEDIAPPE